MKSFFRSFLPAKTGQVDTNDDSMECLNTCLRQVKPCMSLARTQHAETKFDPRPLYSEESLECGKGIFKSEGSGGFFTSPKRYSKSLS